MAGFRISVALAPGADFAIVGETLDELMEQYQFAGGDPAWLHQKVKEMIPLTEQGEGVGALSAMISAELATHDMSEPQEDTPSGGSQTATRRVDPWSGDPVPESAPRRSVARTEPSRGSSGSGSGGSAPDVRMDTDKWGNRWTFNLPEAPDCEHGEKAARFQGTSQRGNKYTVYKCARGGPGGDWQSKCGFSKFPD